MKGFIQSPNILPSKRPAPLKGALTNPPSKKVDTLVELPSGETPLQKIVKKLEVIHKGVANINDYIEMQLTNLKSSNIVEPLAVKNQIISAATEAACMILRIDDVIATAKSAGPPPGAEGGMPPGMGGMGGMPPGMGMPDMGM